MRRAVAAAGVGDDVLDGDPTTRALEERVADLLGHEAALFFPTGTQANQVALGLHAAPGSEVVVEANSHIIRDELAGAAAIWGVQLRPVEAPGGVLSPEGVRAVVRSPAPDVPRTALVAVENTHNAAGGKITGPAALASLIELAREMGLAFHVDGARLWHAAAALGVEVWRLAAPADTVMVSFSKGLGCPVGSCLAGSRELMARGVTLRRRLGGGMRQSGLLAAAALFALDHHLDRLGEDHEHARRFAAALSSHPAFEVVQPETNIVMLDLHALEARVAQEALRGAGVRLSVFGPRRLRAVMHLGITGDDVSRAAGLVGDTLRGLAA